MTCKSNVDTPIWEFWKQSGLDDIFSMNGLWYLFVYIFLF